MTEKHFKDETSPKADPNKIAQDNVSQKHNHPGKTIVDKTFAEKNKVLHPNNPTTAEATHPQDEIRKKLIKNPKDN